ALRRKTERFAQRSKMLFNQFSIEAIVTGGHGRMCSEDHFPRHPGNCIVKAYALFLHAHADRLQHRKSAVPFIQVKNSRCNAHGFEGAKSSYTQQQLLADSRPRVSAIKPRSQFPVFGSVALYIR